MASHSIKAFIGRREGFVTVAYPDGDHYSIGFGHNGPDVKRGARIKLQPALLLFDADLLIFQQRLKKQLKGKKLLPQQEDGLLSAAYNLGNAGISSVVRRINADDFIGAMDELETLCKIKQPDDGDPETPPIYVESGGLLKRRQAERRIFELGDYGDISKIPFYVGNPYKALRQWMPFPKEI